jgi:hypothetical protein
MPTGCHSPSIALIRFRRCGPSVRCSFSVTSVWLFGDRRIVSRLLPAANDWQGCGVLRRTTRFPCQKSWSGKKIWAARRRKACKSKSEESWELPGRGEAVNSSGEAERLGVKRQGARAPLSPEPYLRWHHPRPGQRTGGPGGVAVCHCPASSTVAICEPGTLALDRLWRELQLQFLQLAEECAGVNAQFPRGLLAVAAVTP